jgi:alginate O-acetyltransferase complex protein AlgI
MLFNSLVFLFAFLPVTYAVFWLLRSAPARYVWLTLTGYVFYGYWDPRFCLLMLFSTLVSYLAGIGILRFGHVPRQRRALLAVAVSVDLLLLGFFKYAGFLARSANGVLEAAGLGAAVPVVDVVLPVGISFYTFHTISYMVDAYRGQITPTRNFFEFSAYVSLFSQLVAGPIVRFRQIERDLEAIAAADRTRELALGCSFFVFGLVEKVLVADSLAHFVDPAFADPAALSMAGAWGATLGYTLQLYFDFSGYSSMAVGLGLLFGLHIPINFNSPYKARNPSDFWGRWHISLSTCMRDYLYIPLGGNRHGAWRTHRNLMLTMAIGGLWHGAAWTFVVWGVYHGVLLVLYRHLAPWWDRAPALAQRAAMFLLALLGWVPFRASSFGDSAVVLGKLFSAPAGFHDVPLVLAALLALGLAWAAFGPNVFDFHREHRPTAPRALALAAVFGLCLAVIVGNRNSPFLYFQF